MIFGCSKGTKDNIAFLRCLNLPDPTAGVPEVQQLNQICDQGINDTNKNLIYISILKNFFCNYYRDFVYLHIINTYIMSSNHIVIEIQIFDHCRKEINETKKWIKKLKDQGFVVYEKGKRNAQDKVEVLH